MRITRDTLLRVVRDTVAQRTRADRGLMAIYLCGSLLEEEFLLGGATDLDLVLIHSDVVPTEREIVHLTDEVHIDIAHHHHREYRQNRRLRVHPWLGPTLFNCSILHDPQHFLDFTQASVRGQFDRSDYVMARARPLAEHARQIWLGLHTERPEPGPSVVASYLRSIDHAVNAIASLSGPPLTERRFLLNFPARADAVGRPGLYPGLLGLLGNHHTDALTLAGWIQDWQAGYLALSAEQAPARLAAGRRTYFQKAFEAMVKSDKPQDILWPLVRTWTQIIRALPDGAAEGQSWNTALERLGLIGDGFAERLEALDAYLDMVEETLDNWARANGALE